MTDRNGSGLTAARGPVAAEHICLYNAAEFNRLNMLPGDEHMRIDADVEGSLVGSLSGVLRDGEFTSGFSAPFGGPDFVRSSVDPVAVALVLRNGVEILRSSGCRLARIKARPAYGTRVGTFVQFALLNEGFTVERCELNFHIDLSEIHDVEGYVAKLKPPARRALRHSAEEPFSFQEARSEPEWAIAYDLLARNRKAKGRALKLKLPYLLMMAETFAGRVRMWVLAHADEPCAAALVYRTEARVQQVVYWGDSGHSLARSPMNELAKRVVEMAINEGMSVLDLGISSLDGAADPGLVQFKQSVLAQPQLRLDFVRKL